MLFLTVIVFSLAGDQDIRGNNSLQGVCNQELISYMSSINVHLVGRHPLCIQCTTVKNSSPKYQNSVISFIVHKTFNCSTLLHN